MKYPRTYHLPWSPGATSDDKKLSDGWFEAYRGKEIVITEKLDGENTCMTSRDVYARSHGAPTRSSWSRNLWDSSDGLYWRVRGLIGEGELVFGENLYGVHSIKYDALPAYWHMFAASDGERWYSWDEVREFAEMLGVPTVPELWRGAVETEEDLKMLVLKFAAEPSRYGPEREGAVVRTADGFPVKDFPKHVCKYVRARHVRTDEHWTRNWRKARLKDGF